MAQNEARKIKKNNNNIDGEGNNDKMEIEFEINKELEC